jgi:7-cyano-7-deazaguanine synthase in queuosine biosynthesis
MGTITDILYVGKKEVRKIQDRYPNCIICDMSDSMHEKNKFGIVIMGVNEEDYYNYLVDSLMATSSAEFRFRMECDSPFKTRMTARARNLLKENR